jgi:1,4-dihydroxy-2-naphthoate polyprenyltransferase
MYFRTNMIAVWLSAFRLRTLPLALSSIGMGTFLAAWRGFMDYGILTLCIITTIFLQVLSNLANDLGDSIHGADHEERKGPQRSVQSGAISKASMINAVILFVVLSFLSGIILLIYTFANDVVSILSFLGIGLLSIAAAIAYTVGKKPYGYAGLGDIAVLIFFGLVGVLGSYYLFAKSLTWDLLLPALSSGLLAVAVLNVNNIRDIESDTIAGKRSIPVRIGKSNAIIYHWVLLIISVLSVLVFSLIHFSHAVQFLYLIILPLIISTGRGIANQENIDPYLKKTALTAFFFVILFGTGLLLS